MRQHCTKLKNAYVLVYVTKIEVLLCWCCRKSAENMEDEISRQWTNKETKLLINIRLSHEYEFSKGRRKKSILWNNVLQDIKNVNSTFPFDRMDINKKFVNLMITYKRIIKRNLETGRISTTWEYFDEFDNVYKWSQMVKEEPPEEYISEPISFEEYSVDVDEEESEPETMAVIQPQKKRKIQEILEFLAKESAEDERRHQELVDIEREKIEIEKKKLKLLNSLVNSLQSFCK